MANWQPHDVLNFWFDKNKTPEQNLQFWFGGTPEIDKIIRDKFEAAVESALGGELSHWSESADGSLALIILLDQFPMNIFRGQAKSYESIRPALPLAQRSIERAFDKNRTVFERAFFYLPFEHAEDLEMQKRSMELFGNLLKDAEPHDKEYAELFLGYAQAHIEVIERFGRFPTWNKVLNRTSTAEEAEYVASGKSPF